MQFSNLIIRFANNLQVGISIYIFIMDLVSRLKQYINYCGVAVTAFADECNIPRPTLSQLLNGRNKRVSDELLRKIHDAYPDLSVMWLMFGEGQMLAQSDKRHENAIAEIPETEVERAPDTIEAPIFAAETQSTVTTSDNLTFDFTTDTDEFATQFTADTTTQHPSDSEVMNSEKQPANDNKPKIGAETHPPKTITFSSEGAKTIVNIIVYYSDNSYEAFGPLK